jgi:hypothetical protein
MGTSLGTEKISTIAANAGEVGTDVKRYTINRWKEQ